jgi:hypothetical protein
MPNLTPEQRAEMVDDPLASETFYERLQRRLGKYQCNISKEDQAAIRWALAEIEKLATESNGLAQQVATMRDALEAVEEDVPDQYDYLGPGGHEDVQQKPNPRYEQLQAALALPITAAEQQARSNQKKAELLDWLFPADDFCRVSELYEEWNGEEPFLDFCQAQKEASREGK